MFDRPDKHAQKAFSKGTSTPSSGSPGWSGLRQISKPFTVLLRVLPNVWYEPLASRVLLLEPNLG